MSKKVKNEDKVSKARKKLSTYLTFVFLMYPKTKRLFDFKAELTDILTEKYIEFTAEGMSDKEAFAKCKESISDYDDTIYELQQRQTPQNLSDVQRRILLVSSAIFWAAVILVYVTIILVLGSANNLAWLTFVGGMVIYLMMLMGFLNGLSNKKTHFIRFSIFVIFLLICTAVFLMLSFTIGHWYLTWMVYLVGFIIWYLIDIIYRIRNGLKPFNSLDLVILIAVMTTAVFLLVSFLTHKWAVTWMIFLIGGLLAMLAVCLNKFLTITNHKDRK